MSELLLDRNINYEGAPDEDKMEFPDGTFPEYAEGTPKSVIDADFSKAQNYANAPKLTSEPIATVTKSALKYGKDMITPILEPVQTAKNLFSLGSSIASLIRPGEQGNEQLAKNVGQYFVEKYGGLENAKRSVLTDPVGVLGDVSAVFTGGATLVGKAGKLAAVGGTQTGKNIAQAIDKSAQKVSNVAGNIDLATLTSKIPVSKAPDITTSVMGTLSGASPKALKIAYEAGAEGGRKKELFLEGLKNQNNEYQLVEEALEAFKGLKEAKQKAFEKSNAALNLEKIRLSPNLMNEALSKIDDNFTKIIGGEKVSKLVEGGADAAKLKQIKKVLSEYTNNPNLHNASGADLIKKKLDKLYPPINEMTKTQVGMLQTARRIVNDTIKKADKSGTYKKMNIEYEKAIKLENDIINELSVKGTGKINKGTILRKLKSALTDTGSTRFANRAELIDTLNPELTTKLSGAALNPILPTGLGSRINQGFLSTAVGFADPRFLLSAGTTSPRLLGNIAYGSGQIAGQRRNLAQALRNRRTSIPQSIRNRFNQDNLIGALQGSRFYGQTLE